MERSRFRGTKTLRHFITRAFTDGKDFIGSDIHRPAGENAGRNGFGDMICEVSNLIAQTNKADILHFGVGKSPFSQNIAYRDFIKLIDMSGKNYKWINDPMQYEQWRVQSNSNEQLCKLSERELLNCQPDHPYVKLDPNKFSKEKLELKEYVTYQSNPFSKKCKYDRPHVQKEYVRKIKERGIPAVDIGGLEDAGLPTIAAIVKNSVAHVGIDSGMTHFALCIKDKKDVDIVVPEDRISAVSYRWIEQKYNVALA